MKLLLQLIIFFSVGSAVATEPQDPHLLTFSCAGPEREFAPQVETNWADRFNSVCLDSIKKELEKWRCKVAVSQPAKPCTSAQIDDSRKKTECTVRSLNCSTSEEGACGEQKEYLRKYPRPEPTPDNFVRPKSFRWLCHIDEASGTTGAPRSHP